MANIVVDASILIAVVIKGAQKEEFVRFLREGRSKYGA